MASGFGESDGLEESPLADQARSSLFQNLDSSHRIEEISFDRAFNDLDQGWIVGGTFDRPRLYRNVSESGASTAGPLMGSLSETCGFLPPTPPSSLGDRSFIRAHGLNQAYVGGSMANGIASVDLVSSLVKAGNLAFYGAAGQTPDRVDFALQELERRNRGGAWGCNLIHSPAEPTIESEVARLLGLRRVRHVEASAYLDLTEPLVKLRIQSLHREPSGEIVPRISIMAKASRLEVASKFLSPAPAEWISRLLEQGEISSEQAQWAKEWPICDDLTAEADSGGHTDNRPLTTLVPAFCDLRDRIGANLPRALGVRVGAAGGLGTPAAIASALALGAGYVVIGSVHQACIESGSSQLVRDMLAQAGPADVIMAPASDMFEMGVHLQVLRRGTMFGTRARRLLELYRKHTCIEEIPIEDRQRIEKEIFRMPLEEVWAYTRDFFLEREPKTGGTGRDRCPPQNGSHLPLVSWEIIGLGQSRGSRSSA